MALSLRSIGLGLRLAVPTMLGGGVLLALLLGAYASLDALTPLGAGLLASLGIAVCSLWVGRLLSRSRFEQTHEWKEAELGALLVIGAFAVVEPHGRVDNPVFPLLYLLMAFITASSPFRVTLLLTSLAMAIEISLFLVHGGGGGGWPAQVSRQFFLAAFALLPRVALAWEAASARISGQRELQRKEQARREHARRFRLSAATGSTGKKVRDIDLWSSAAVAELEDAVHNTLEVARLALDVRSVSVFLVDPEEGGALRLFACWPRVETLLRRRFDAKEGLLGVVSKRREPLRLCGDLRGVAWQEREAIRSVLIVPLHDEAVEEAPGVGTFRGLLVADRAEARPFDDVDEKLLVASSKEILRAIESEWVMVQIRKDRQRAEDTYRAIEKLNRSTRIDEVLDTAVAEIRSIMGAQEKDLVAITTVEADEKGKRFHEVVRIVGAKGLEKIQGKSFADGICLVSQAVRHGRIFPERAVLRMEKVFGEDTLVRGVSSLKVVPLRMGTEVLGTLTFGCEREGALDEADVSTLELLASQVAQSLQRATYYARTEALAETDGLTGLANRRIFEDRLQREVNLAKRYRRAVSVIVADIDHFKTVNDTYGHLTGDEILRKVAQILKAGARDTDLVARYGGEEFTLILSDTDMAGGKVTAERIRMEVEKTVFSTSLGPLRCTLSLGIASHPQVEAEDLLEQADQALYHSKRMGRNRATTVWEMQRELGHPVAAAQR